MERSKKEFQILYELSRLNSSSINLNQLLNVTMQLIINFFKAEVGLILFFDENEYKFYSKVIWGMDFDTINSIYYENTKIIYWILSHDEPILINDFFKDEKVEYKNNKKVYIQTILGAKLKSKDRLLGAIFIANKTEKKDIVNFEDDDVKFFKPIVNNIAVAIDNYLLYEEILNTKNFNQSIIDSLSTGVITTNTELKITTFNKAAENIFNIEKDKVINKDIKNILKDINLKDKIIEILKKKSNELNMEVLFNDEISGITKVLNMSISLLTNIKGEVIGNVLTVDDISEKKLIEQQMARTEKLAALGELSAGIAHEIKNPLTAIKGFAQILPRKLEDRDFLEKFSHIMDAEVSRLNGIVENLLAFARPSGNKMQRCNIIPIIYTVLNLLNYQIEKAGIKIELKLKEVPDIMGDKNKLEQVLINIIINALQAMQNYDTKNDKIIRIFTEVVLRRSKDNIYQEYAVVHIEDTGPGIEKDVLKKLFNPFFTTKPKGSGLGLAITHRIISEHNGFIEVDSKVGKGTLFSLFLPTINNFDDINQEK